MTHQVFISHASQDKPFAKNIQRAEDYKIIPIIFGEEITSDIVKHYIMGRDILSILSSPATVAGIWHQTGMGN